MTNTHLAELLTRVADLLEIKGEDRFRVLSYRKAARVMDQTTADVAALAAAGQIESLDGIGKGLGGRITEYIATGRFSALEEAQAGLPAGLAELLAVSGLGPKTVAVLHRQLGVGSLDDLKAALDGDTIEKLPGMGPKKVANIRRGLAELLALRASGAASRVPLGRALATAEAVIDSLRRRTGLTAIEAAGSLRRRRETIGDIDLLAAAAPDTAAEVLAAFVSQPGVATVLAHGQTKASIKMADGLQIDLRVVAPEVWGAAWQYFTGSKDHNVRLRERAVARGWRLSEYGLFDAAGVCLAAANEHEIYNALGLAWIPPELREDQGEIAAAAFRDDPAERRDWPGLIDLADIRGDLHMHTTASDGHHTIVEMARAAARRGYAYLAITDHSQSLGVANGLRPDRLVRHIADIRAAQAQVPEIRLLAGTESDILEDGRLDYDDELLAQLDLVVGSVHSSLKMDADAMTARLLRALAHPRLHILGHPTGRLLGRRAPVAADWSAVLAAAARYGKAMECNASVERLDLNDQMCHAAAAAGVMLSINTDAHAAEQLDVMPLGVATARRGGVRPAQVLNTRDAEALQNWLGHRRLTL